MTDVAVHISRDAALPECRHWELGLRLRETRGGEPIPFRLLGGERVYVVQDEELRGFVTANAITQVDDRHVVIRCSGWVPCRLRAKVRRMRRRWTYRWWNRGSEITTTDGLQMPV